MRVAIDISPLSSGHRVRGIGSYVKMIKDNIGKFDKSNEYMFVDDKKFPSDIDLIHYPYFDPFFITLPRKFQTKTIVTVHDLTPLVFPKHFPVGIRGKIKWLIQKSRLKKADLIITDSNCSGRDVGDIVGIPEDKIRTVYLAAGEKFVKLDKGSWTLDIRKKYSLPEQFLLYVGDVTWNKNLPRLIQAVKKTKHKLVLIGKIWSSSISEISNNPWDKDLKFVLKEIENDEQFVKLGFVPDEDLVKICNLATALIMPSIYEGFGLPVLEAMNCGCPVICSRAGSLPEVAGDAALYVDPENRESIKEAIEKIFSTPALRDELKKKGLEQSKRFSSEKMMRDLIKIYEEVHG